MLEKSLWAMSGESTDIRRASAKGDHRGIPARNAYRDLLIADGHTLFTPDILAGSKVAQAGGKRILNGFFAPRRVEYPQIAASHAMMKPCLYRGVVDFYLRRYARHLQQSGKDFLGSGSVV